MSSEVLLRGLLGTIFRCLMLLFFLRNHFHVGLHLPQCTMVFSSSKWKHFITAAVRLFLVFFFFLLFEKSAVSDFFLWNSYSNIPFISKGTTCLCCTSFYFVLYTKKNLHYTGNSKHGEKTTPSRQSNLPNTKT